MRDGIAEVGHKAIAHILSVIAFVLFDDLLGNLMKIVDGIAEVFGVEIVRQYARVDEITRQEGHLSPICAGFSGARSMGWQVRRRSRISRSLRHHRATTVAKLVAG